MGSKIITLLLAATGCGTFVAGLAVTRDFPLDEVSAPALTTVSQPLPTVATVPGASSAPPPVSTPGSAPGPGGTTGATTTSSSSATVGRPALPITLPTTTFPPITLPSITIPTVTLPEVTLSTLPTVTLPTITLPTVTIPEVTVPDPVRIPTVPLGAAAGYAVLAASTVTNTGLTVVTGGLGLSPGTSVTGFLPGLVVGVTDVANGIAGLAQSDLTGAYLNAAGRAATTISGELGGLTLTTGVYAGPGRSPLHLTGTLTLDAAGDPGAVFIFQTDSTLTTASSSRVNLINGARACNVFWQVGSSATLGTGSTFAGTIMALASITVTTDVTIQGRVLARNGAVTLDSNIVATPPC